MLNGLDFSFEQERSIARIKLHHTRSLRDKR